MARCDGAVYAGDYYSPPFGEPSGLDPTQPGEGCHEKEISLLLTVQGKLSCDSSNFFSFFKQLFLIILLVFYNIPFLPFGKVR